MGRAPGAITRHGRWQYLLLAAGLFLFALLVYAADPRVVLRTFTHLGWLTPLLALPYFTSEVPELVEQYAKAFEKVWAHRGEVGKG